MKARIGLINAVATHKITLTVDIPLPVVPDNPDGFYTAQEHDRRVAVYETAHAEIQNLKCGKCNITITYEEKQ